MATGPFTTDRMRLGWGYTGGNGTITGGTFLPVRTLPVATPEIVEQLAGHQATGAYMPGKQRAGSRHFALTGVEYDLYHQAAAGTRFPHYELLLANGWVETVGSGGGGSELYVYTLGDPHFDGDTPDGDLTLLAPSGTSKYLGYIIDTQCVEATNVATDIQLVFTPGDIPKIVCGFFGQIPAVYTAAVPSLCTVSPPSVSALLAASQFPFQSAGLTMASLQSTSFIEGIVISTGARISLAKDANQPHGVGVPKIAGYRPVGSMRVRAHNDTLEVDRLAGTARTLAFNDGGTALGSGGAGKIAVSMSITVTGGIQVDDGDGFKTYDVDFEMNPAGTLSLTFT